VKVAGFRELSPDGTFLEWDRSGNYRISSPGPDASHLLGLGMAWKEKSRWVQAGRGRFTRKVVTVKEGINP